MLLPKTGYTDFVKLDAKIWRKTAQKPHFTRVAKHFNKTYPKDWER